MWLCSMRPSIMRFQRMNANKRWCVGIHVSCYCPIHNGRKEPMSSSLTLWSLSAIDVPYSCKCTHMYRYVQYVCDVLLPSCMVHCRLFPLLHVCWCSVDNTVSSTPFYLTVAALPHRRWTAAEQPLRRGRGGGGPERRSPA